MSKGWSCAVSTTSSYIQIVDVIINNISRDTVVLSKDKSKDNSGNGNRSTHMSSGVTDNI